MGAKYYVSIRPQTNEDHIIHKEDCPFLPDTEKRIYLGLFCSCIEAGNAGLRHFSLTNFCPFCLKEHHQTMKKPFCIGDDLCELLPSPGQLSMHLSGSQFYFLN